MWILHHDVVNHIIAHLALTNCTDHTTSHQITSHYITSHCTGWSGSSEGRGRSTSNGRSLDSRTTGNPLSLSLPPSLLPSPSPLLLVPSTPFLFLFTTLTSPLPFLLRFYHPLHPSSYLLFYHHCPTTLSSSSLPSPISTFLYCLLGLIFSLSCAPFMCLFLPIDRLWDSSLDVH